MTPDERKMLSDLADKIAKTPAPPKDPEAEEFIRTRIGSRPDALYLMTQTVLIQNLALEHARQQLQELQQRHSIEPAPVAPGGSFLGQQGPGRSSSGYSSGQQYSAPPPPPQYAPPSPAGPSPSGAPSFLRGAAQTAAGVAAGALAFEGIQALFSHPGYGGFGGFGGPGFMSAGVPAEETVINNYYDTPPGSDRADLNDYRADDRGDNVYAPDDAGNVEDVSNVNDVGNVDDTNQYDDSGQFDDSSDFGDSGGFDDSGGGDSFV